MTITFYLTFDDLHSFLSEMLPLPLYIALSLIHI